MLVSNYKSSSVASPRKMKNPPLSVTAVINTLEPIAGSRPNFLRVNGIMTPTNAASKRFNIIASAITKPRDAF